MQRRLACRVCLESGSFKVVRAKLTIMTDYDMDCKDVKPSSIARINAASLCLDQAAEAVKANGAVLDDVVDRLNVAQNIACGIVQDPQVGTLIREVMQQVFESITTMRRLATEGFPLSTSPSGSPPESGCTSYDSISSPSSSPPDVAVPASRAADEAPDDVGALISALRRHVSPDMGLSSLAGMATAKQMLTEAVVMPMQYRHLFTGARKPWQSVLLYGPPGTGKTRLALAVAAEVGAELYAISPADLLSSWFGQTEQNIRKLFGQLRDRARTNRVIVFLDEVDGLCRRRTNEEAESTRRMKTELLTQLQEGIQGPVNGPAPPGPPPQALCPLRGVRQGVPQDLSRGFPLAAPPPPSAQDGQLFFVCATNCPWEIDPAFLRRFQRRIFIGLPDRECRQEIIRTKACSGDSGDDGGQTELSLHASDWQRLLDSTEGFSGSDLADLVKNALYQPIRELATATHWVPSRTSIGMWMPCSINTIGAVRQNLQWFPARVVCARNVTIQDFYDVIANARPTVSPDDLGRYDGFTAQFGQLG